MRGSIIFLLILCLAGCGSSSGDFGVSGSVGAAATSPPAPNLELLPARALPDRYWVAEGETLQESVLANDALLGGKIVEFPTREQPNGLVNLSDQGELTYTPRAAVRGQSLSGVATADVFSYTVENAAGRSTASVHVNTAPVVYVNNQAAPGGDGSKTKPFNTLREALDSFAGQARIFQVARGDGTGTGLGDDYVLSPGQAIVGENAKSPPLITGIVTMADNTMLKNLSLEVARPNGCVVATARYGVVLTNLRFSDQGSLASAILLTACGNVDASHLVFENLPSDPLAIVTPATTTVVNDATFARTNGGIFVDAQFTSGIGANVELNKLRCDNVSRLIKIRASNTSQLTLLSDDCKPQQIDGTSLIEAEVSDTATVSATFQRWNVPVVKLTDGKDFANASLINWQTRGSAQSQVQLPIWQVAPSSYIKGNGTPDVMEVFPKIQNPVTFESHDDARASIVFYKTGFDYPNTLNLKSFDSSTMWVRMEDYAQLSFGSSRKSYDVNVSGHQSSQCFARFHSPEGFFSVVGMNPHFDFSGSSNLTIVRLFGWNDRENESIWRTDNGGGDDPVVNGVEMDQFQSQQYNAADYPNYDNRDNENGLNIPEPVYVPD
jgi:hypothetical protein